ncbi:MAG: hypothetical protein Q9227_004034 [Pyrenula ochraceoflavens]
MTEAENSNAASTPEDPAGNDVSSNRDSISKGPAVKDKECPYCHQPFTSSSLGRHLDQYLAKKKPDGIHNVEEIRRLRGGITRRQAKPHKQDGQRQDDSGLHSSPAPLQTSPTTESLIAPVAGGIGTRFNSPIWQSTGVINGIPDPRIGIVNGAAQTSSSPIALRKSATASSNGIFNIDANRPEQMPDKELARALDLALREILDNVRAAGIRTLPTPSPFTIDLQSLTFPALCLYFLPTPPTLFSSGPFSTSTSFPVEPPTATHLEPVRAAALQTIEQWKTDQLAHISASSPTTATEITAIAHQHTELVSRHIDIAFHAWSNTNSDMQRYEQWRLEILRAFARERNRREETEDRLARAQVEAKQLQAQVEMLSRCQWPREFALFPPERGTVGKRLAKDGIRDLQSQKHRVDGSDLRDRDDNEGQGIWDYETVLGKWKRVVREETARTLGVIASQTGASSNGHEVIEPQASETPMANGHMEDNSDSRSAEESAAVRGSKRSKLSNGTAAAMSDKPIALREYREEGPGGAFFGKRPLREVQL